MMRDYELLFSQKLQNKLHERIIGSVYVAVTKDDILYIHIRERDSGIDYEYIFRNFSRMVLYNVSSDEVMRTIMKDYKEYIMSKYFK